MLSDQHTSEKHTSGNHMPENPPREEQSSKDHDSDLRIVTYPADVLAGKSQPVTRVDGRVVSLARGMASLMVTSQGIGLAAPQVGVARRIITANVGDGCIYLINPVTVSYTHLRAHET